MSARPLGSISGTVVRGDGRGRALGFPTANLCGDGGDLPDDGIYAAWVVVDDLGERMPASVSVGSNPTFAGERPRRVEVHLHDVDIDLYGRHLRVELVAYLRPTLTFAGADELVAQSRLDVASCREALGRDV
ncbi:riboflavin kinase [Streptomyces sp. AC495_CC817]|uniref:riboflavin kinase n=1 Tax=Streptomyces sp. AC495_CC817 TaxID=2823900 RepID=UPI001C255A89|nr:riboflavin kinase [Streptomyces sp. AC495_CC817]